MAYGVMKVSSGFKVIDPALECREDWIFQAFLLGYKDSPTPAMDFVTYVSEKYPSVDILREFYVTDQNRYQEVCGFNLTFGNKKEATAYAEELNI